MFILEQGVMGWGLLTGFLFAAWTCYENGGLTTREFFTPFIFFPIGGIFWGAFMWAFWKKRYVKQQLENGDKVAEQDVTPNA